MKKEKDQKNKRVAVFDIDGTIFRSSLLIELVEILIERGIFSEEARDIYKEKEKQWLERKGEYKEYIDAVVDTFLKHIKGVHYSDFADISSEVALRYKHHVYRYTRKLVQDLRKKEYFLLAISQSPKTIVEEFCKNIGFDKVYGTIFELGPEDRFTGVPVDLHLIANKSSIVRRAVEKEGLTLSGSYGVGDTESDISFLELVENPIAFNPNAQLHKYAKRMGWKVVVERKDVIYEIGK
jgi:HAD superfamily hydrolase (TIGR01490 family)